MKVCLVSPPTVTEYIERHMDESEARQLIAEQAPLGILSLAAVLEGVGLTPHVVDLNHLYYAHKLLGDRRLDNSGFSSYAVRVIGALDFDVVGLSTICSTYPLTLRIAEALKRARPEATVMLGGPQASVVDVLTMKEFPFVDFVVRGEAEATLPRLLEAISQGSGVEHIDGVTYRRGADIFRKPNAQVIGDLDELPLPAFHLYPDIERCHNFPLEAGRGCPFACSFCSTNDFFRRRFRMKSPDVLIKQMRLINRTYGASSFDLVHDMFTIDRKKVVGFCEALAGSGEKFSWSCSARTDCIDEELIETMAGSGCRGVFFGIDSGSEKIQAILNKGLNLDDAASRIRSTTRRGITTTVSLITGFPEEQEDDLRATIKFFGESLRYKNTVVQLHLLAPLAETPITTQYKEQLVYDQIFSDISFQGWVQSPEDYAMTVGNKDIFTNFYAIPTRWLDRRLLMELREFLLHGTSRHRGLITFLHQDSGDLTEVFHQWKRWLLQGSRGPSTNSIRDYYSGPQFTKDLVKFLGSHYARVLSKTPHLATTLARIEAAFHSRDAGRLSANGSPLRRRRQGPVAVSASTVPVVAEGVRMMSVDADYKRIIRCLRRREHLGRIPPRRTQLLLLNWDDQLKVFQPSELICQLLRLCDGTRGLMEVVQAFRPGDSIGGVPAASAGLFGLHALRRQGLIETNSPAGV